MQIVRNNDLITTNILAIMDLVQSDIIKPAHVLTCCTGLVAQLAERRAWYPKVLGSITTFSTKYVTCLSPAVGDLK
jgi:hypothetical protein